jgi:hypothetical protein
VTVVELPLEAGVEVEKELHYAREYVPTAGFFILFLIYSIL